MTRRSPTARSPTTRSRASTTTASAAASPACSASGSWRCCSTGLFWVVRRRGSPRRARRQPCRQPSRQQGLMGAGHGHRLHFHGHSVDPPRARAPQAPRAASGFMLLVVATPRSWHAAYAVEALVLLGVVALSRVPVTYLAPRMLVELPFAIFAVLVPFISHGPHTEVLGADRVRARPARRHRAAHQGHPGRARLAHPRRHHRAAGPAARPPAAADARPDRADHGLHDPLPRRRHRRARPDDDGPALARLRPALAAPLAGAGPVAGGAVHPILRTR